MTQRRIDRVILSAARKLSACSVVLLFCAPAAAQVTDQTFEVTPEVHRATVGDSVTVRFRVRLDERDLLFDTIPQPVSQLPPGVRLLSVEKMIRSPDRIFHGQARLAFYRTGRRPVPVFGLPFMRAVKGLQRGTLASDSAFIEIVPLLPAGNPSLKDIKEPELGARRDLGPLLIAAAVVALLTLVLRRRRRRPSPIIATAAIPAALEVAPMTAFEQALLELDRIARADWPGEGRVARHYEAIVDVLREYLASSEEIPARERTTEELLWALPPHLSEEGRRESLRDLLDEADLVKFAKFRPSTAAAGVFLESSRNLLRQWHRAASTASVTDALR